jgi:putative ABC transport system substrate-binding protein
MTRRGFIALLGAATALRPIALLAQRATSRALIAVMIGASKQASERWRSGLPQGLKELGYVEGQDYDIEYRYADGDLTRQPALLEELIQHDPKIIVVGNWSAALAAKQATSRIPIIVASTVDPIGSGLATSVARPKENVTGMFVDYGSLLGKQLELGFELFGIRRVGMLLNVNNPIAASLRQDTEAAAKAMAAQLISAEIRTPTDIDAAFQSLAREGVKFVVVYPDPMFLGERWRFADLEIKTHLAAVYSHRAHVEAGGLMSYGVEIRENWRRIAVYVDKILKGAKPVDLPFEQPTKFELVINLKTARALGMTIPEAFLLRADEVIE